MANNSPSRIWYLGTCLVVWGIGGPVLINSELLPSNLLNKELASVIEISIWTLICFGAGFAGTKLFGKSSQKEEPALPVANVVTFNINKDFAKWAKEFDDDLENQQEAGLKPIFRAVSKENSSQVLAIFVAIPGAIEIYWKENQERISKSGQVLGSEVISAYSMDY